MKTTATVLTLMAAVALPSQAAWQRLPSVDKRPLNMASDVIEGTKVESSSGIGSVNALVHDNSIEKASIPAGQSYAVLNVGTQRIFERVSLMNGGVEGRLSVSVSSDKSAFTPVGQTVISPADSLIYVDFAGIQGRYIRVDFESSRAGSISSFQVFGNVMGGDYVLEQSDDGTGGQSVNAGSGMGGARVIYAFPEPVGGGDDAVKYGTFAFPESDEKYRTVIYDLGAPRFLNEFGSVHSPRPVRLEVFAFSELPETEDWRGRRAFDPATFDTTAPIASVEDGEGVGYVKVKPKQTVKARYVALRWEPDFNPPGFSVGGVNIGSGGITGVNPNDNSNSGGAGQGNGQQQSPQPGGPFIPNSVSGGGVGGLPATRDPNAGQGGGNQGGGGNTVIVRPIAPVSN